MKWHMAFFLGVGNRSLTNFEGVKSWEKFSGIKVCQRLALWRQQESGKSSHSTPKPWFNVAYFKITPFETMGFHFC